ncbi:uncharacterized protein LOC142181558 [Nicotiana tabacum]|uniref:Uncharacterized protein LOC142181558 n=1 Tax=Nicotiana tabacum TaxID=4097 RepID=A0AC58UM62_TOBAC
MGTSLMIQSLVPITFWGECVKTTMYLINKLPITILDGKIPYKLLYVEAPKLENVRVFGCLSYARNFLRNDKLAARARRAVFLRYSDTQKGYKLFDLDTRTFFISRDVSFRETIFPFKTGKSYDDDLLFVSITDAIGKVLQPKLPDATNLPIEAHNSSPSNGQLEPVAPTNLAEVDETSDSTLEVQAETEEEIAPIHEPSMVDQPIDSSKGKRGEYKVCKLIKSLYDLKQASRQWNIKLTDALLVAGYKQSSYDHSLFTKQVGGEIVIILVYVDDLLITGSCKELIQEARTTLYNIFKVKDLEELRHFLGIEVMRSKNGILIN